MASLVLTIGGSALGNALLPGIGGALLGGIGAYVGGQIDNAVFGNSKVSGPRLDSLKIQDSTYGKTIPVVYGNARVAGNVIWCSDLIETLSSDQVGGKGGGSQTSVQRASYAVDCAIAIGMGIQGATIGNIRTIWADSKIIYSDGQWRANIVADAEMYMGGMSQLPSSLMESYLGAGNVPAYRGLAYVVLHRLQLANFGNRLPNLTFECYAADAPTAPSLLGEVNPVLLSRPQSMGSYGALPAIPLARNGAGVTRMLVGGVIQTGVAFQFAVLEMDVTGDIPVELRRTLSPSFTRSSDLADVSWALSPDGLVLAFYMQHYDAGNPAAVVIYDIAAHSFGSVVSENLGYSSTLNQIAWLDEQRFVLQDAVSGQSGVRVYLRAGLTAVALGFIGVWGAGSSSIREPLPFAQFCKLSGGLCMLAANDSVSPTALYARCLSWQGGSLQIGDEVLVSNTLGGFTSTSAALLPISNHEWALARIGTSEIRLLSFAVSFSGINITRSWTSIPVTPSGDISISIKDGRISYIHLQYSTTTYNYGEIALTPSSFSVSAPSSAVAGSYVGIINNVSFYPVDSTRYLMQGGSNSGVMTRLAMVERGNAQQSLGALVGDVLVRAGYSNSDVDVSALDAVGIQGYVVDNLSSARAVLEPLQLYQPFDLIETDGILKAKLYSAVVNVTLNAGELRAAKEKQEQPPALQTTRSQELDLPREISVDYVDAALGFQRGTQRAQRIASNARSMDSVKLPVICDADTAKQIAQSELYRRWTERSEYELYLNRANMKLDAGDVISFDGQAMRITQIDQHGGVIKTTAVPVSHQVIGSGAVADGGSGFSFHALELIGTTLFMLDVPLLRATDDQHGYYVSVTGPASWPGATLLRSTDGVNYVAQDHFSLPVTTGLATTVLPFRTTWYMDRVSTVTIALMRGNISSCTMDELLNGANAALLGNEIIQFQNANLNSDGTVTLSNLLRGRKGSEAATSTHVVGERFILLQPSTVRFMPLNASDRGRRFYYRAASTGQDVNDVPDTLFIPQMNNLRPLAPSHVTGSRNSGADITLSWKRRARKDSEWLDHIDVPLDEPVELYDIEIMNGSNVVRSFLNQTASLVAYMAAQQIADFGSVQSAVTVRIYQLSSRVGRGFAAQATI